MADIIELRRHRRSDGRGAVFAQIGREIVEVTDISVAGMRVERPPSWEPCRNIHFRIIPQIGTMLDFARAVPISGHVVGLADDHLRIAFASVSYPLARIIQAHAECDGAAAEACPG
jgi:hypothetical protein